MTQMEGVRRHFLIFVPLALFLACVCLILGPPARAQDEEDTNLPSPARAENDVTSRIGDQAQQDGPVRMARFSYVQGDVTWRVDSHSEWSAATRNLPLRQGAELWVSEGGRAEIQFDDGSRLRLGSGALVTLQTLYSDAEGEFTEITLKDGPIALRLKHDRSIYQVNTPLVSVKAVGPAKIRIGAGDGVEVAVQEGRATVEGNQGKVDLRRGDYLDLRDENSAYEPRDLPRPDRFDEWNEELDRRLEEAEASSTERYLPANMALVADDLDAYGAWRDDAEYGHVWCPRVTVAHWRPYCYGHWTWVSPFGWTWVSDEPWGWVPYHYGTWIYRPYGWAWVPGPVTQCWSPAVVDFCEYNGAVAWVPLAPREVRYPTSFVSFGFRGNRWAFYFSIAQAAVYYPTYYSASAVYWTPRPWHSHYVNCAPARYNETTLIANYLATHRYPRVIPFNARDGAMMAEFRAFGGRGAYRTVAGSAVSIFARGRAFTAPQRGLPLAGPPMVRPTPLAMTPTRAFVHDRRPPQTMLMRPVFRAPLKPAIARVSAPLPVVASPRTLPRPFASRVRVPGSLRAQTPDSAGRRPSGLMRGRIPTTPGQDSPWARRREGFPPSGRETPSAVARDNRLRRIPLGSTDMNLPRAERERLPSAAALAARRARQSLGLGGGSLRDRRLPEGSYPPASTRQPFESRTSERPGMVWGGRRTRPELPSAAEEAAQARRSLETGGGSRRTWERPRFQSQAPYVPDRSGLAYDRSRPDRLSGAREPRVRTYSPPSWNQSPRGESPNAYTPRYSPSRSTEAPRQYDRMPTYTPRMPGPSRRVDVYRAPPPRMEMPRREAPPAYSGRGRDSSGNSGSGSQSASPYNRGRGGR